MDSRTVKKLLKYKLASDVTKHARELGYANQEPVIIYDGKVISHNNVDWFLFCENLRNNKSCPPNPND